MKIALVHDHLNQLGGAEKVLLSFQDIFSNAPIYTLLYDSQEIGEIFDGLDIRSSFIQKLPFARKKFKWYLSMMPPAIESLDLSNYDVVLSSASAFAKGVITRPEALHICYCHSPTRYLWSDTHMYAEGLKQSKIIKMILPFALSKLRTWDWGAAARVDKFIANSRFVQHRIRKYYGRQSTVIYPPVDTDKFYVSRNVKDYFLVVSRLRPYKKVDLVVKAFNKLNLPLKIIGSGEEEGRLKKMANNNIEFLGWLNQKEKARYLSQCRAFINPQEEDFGITPVEAMASGRPVIAYKSGGALESILENETGIFFNEQNWESLADTIIRFDEKQFSSKRIREHAQQFSRERFEVEIKNFIETSWADFRNERLV